MEAAIENYETGRKTDRNLDASALCSCYSVSENEIRRVIAENGLKTVDEVTNFTKAGGGCGQCKGRIAEILEEMSK